jgi:hypothetical protein
MAETGEDGETAAQVAVDGLGFRGRLNDDDV